MKEYKTSDLRNISIVGGPQTGKTSLGEAILYSSGITSRLQTPDEGSSILDYQNDEIERKISISASPFSVEREDSKLNFIDTPGFSAYVAQVITSVNVCESSLIVIDAESGVVAQTKKAWKYSQKAGQSQIIFINKMDKDRIDFNSLVEDIKSSLSNKVCPISIPIGSGDSFTGVVDIIKQKAYIDKDKTVEEQDVPGDLSDQVQILRLALMENAAENDEQLLEKYLEAGELSDDEFLAGLKMGIASGDIIPLMAGSARKNVGISKTLDLLESLAPSPDLNKKCILVTDDGQEQAQKIESGGVPLLQVFKITDDDKVGEYFFFKILKGELKPSQEFLNINKKQKERVGHLFSFVGKNRNEREKLYAGDILATAKLKSTGIGDTLFNGKDSLQARGFDFPTPVLTEAVKTNSEKDNEKLVEGLHEISRLDPCFQNEHVAEFNQRLVKGMSKLHLESMIGRIKSNLKIDIEFCKPKIPYRETIRGSAKAQGKYKKQTGGHGQYGDCWLEISSSDTGEGYKFEDKISGGVIPSKYIPAISKGVQDAMSRGITAGFPVVDVAVAVYDGSYHNVDSSDLAFQMAGSLAFKNAVEKANPILLEPIMNVTITVPEDCVGDVSADFNQRRGKILNMDAGGPGYRVISANVPMGELYNYAVDLDSMTKGDAEYVEKLEKYEPVPANIASSIISKNKES